MPSSLQYPEMERNGDQQQNSFCEQQLSIDFSILSMRNGDDASSFEEMKLKKSSNMTECVSVPSSEHVAEIVGRQGCKIKALRAKTNTYIKTPVRGEEPVFVVTGRKEDVAMARREILSAAEHFSQIRASRKNNLGGTMAPGPPSPNTPGMMTIQVRVPYRVVGLVVGPKGATIKRIQQHTHTYIVTPSREKEPVFEVTGLQENVERAREEIESHIAMRTGGLIDSSADENDFESNGTDTGNVTPGDLVNSLYGVPINNSFTINGTTQPPPPPPPPPQPAQQQQGQGQSSAEQQQQQQQQQSPSPPSSEHHQSNGTHHHHHHHPLVHSKVLAINGIHPKVTDYTRDVFNPFSTPQMSPDLGIDVSSFDLASTSSAASSSSAISNGTAIWSDVTSSPSGRDLQRRSNSVSSARAGLAPDHPPARRIRSDPLGTSSLAAATTLPSFTPLISSSVYSSTTSSLGSAASFSSGATAEESAAGAAAPSPPNVISAEQPPLPPAQVKKDKECIVCCESKVVAALVPCGHNLFCMECANLLMEKEAPLCPVCQQTVSQAIRIHN